MLFYIINLFIVGFAFAGPNNLEKDAQNKVLQSQKVMWSCHILRQKNADKIIKELELTSKTIPVFLVPKGDNFRPVVKFKIKFPREIGQVFVGKSTPLMASDLKDEQFFYAYLNSRINTVELTAKYKSGEQVKEILYLFAPEAREYQMLEKVNPITFSVGMANLVYDQTSFGVFNSFSFLLGMKYRKEKIWEKWGFYSEGFMSFFTFRSSPLDLNPQYYEASFWGTIEKRIFENPLWSSEWVLGLSTTGLISHGSPFGFSDVLSMDIGIKNEYFKTNNYSYKVDFIYSSFDGFSLSNDRAFKLLFGINYFTSSVSEMEYTFSYANKKLSLGYEQIDIDFIELATHFRF